jgi:hypothetical protein
MCTSPIPERMEMLSSISTGLTGLQAGTKNGKVKIDESGQKAYK